MLYGDSIKNYCQKLHQDGKSLNDLVKITDIPKTTLFEWIKDIKLPLRIKNKFKENFIRARKITAEKRKGKCANGKVLRKPKEWSDELVYIVSHFMFDGGIGNNGCTYYNRSAALVNEMEKNIANFFRIYPSLKVKIKESGVIRLTYCNVELRDYIRNKSEELLEYIYKASDYYKKIFLQSFFDDEGSVYFLNKYRKVRGYQKNLYILKIVQKLLSDFCIKSRIEIKGKEIVISGRENLKKFQGKINFSKGIYINPDRTNSIWKKKIEKKEILKQAINSYL